MVADRAAGRPPKGRERMDETDTAVRAYVAGRLAGRSDNEHLRDELGLVLNSTAARRAAAPLLWHPPEYRAPGRKSTVPMVPGRDDSPSALREWLVVDAPALNLGVALITVPVASGGAQRDTVRSLSTLVGVVQVISAGDGHQRRVLAIVLVDGEQDRRRLRAQLDELVAAWEWAEVDHDSVQPALQTWRHLARAAASRDGLLADGD